MTQPQRAPRWIHGPHGLTVTARPCDCPLPDDPSTTQEAPTGPDGTVALYTITSHQVFGDDCARLEIHLRLYDPAGGDPVLVVAPLKAHSDLRYALQDRTSRWVSGDGPNWGTLRGALLDPDRWAAGGGAAAREHLINWAAVGAASYAAVAPWVRAGIYTWSKAREWHSWSFTDTEAQQWSAAVGAGRSPSRAAGYREAGFTPTSARPWQQACAGLAPVTMARIQEFGLDPAGAVSALSALTGLDYYLEFRPGAWQDEDDLTGDLALLILAATGMPAALALDCARAGFDPNEAADQYRAGTLDPHAARMLAALRHGTV